MRLTWRTSTISTMTPLATRSTFELHLVASLGSQHACSAELSVHRSQGAGLLSLVILCRASPRSGT